MKNILVGVDYHEKTGMLIQKAFELSKPYHSKIWLLHITAPEPDFIGYDVGPQYIRDFRAKEIKKEQKLLTKHVNQLKEKGVDADGLLLQGDTIEAILEESKKLAIDLIIFGHHAHSFIYTLFFGSKSTEIIKRSDIPVLVVPLG